MASKVRTTGVAVDTDKPDHVIVEPTSVPPLEMLVMFEYPAGTASSTAHPSRHRTQFDTVT